MNAETAVNRECHTISHFSLQEKIKQFLSLSDNPIYTEDLLTSIDESVKLLARYPDKTPEGFMLAGSFARYLTGNGNEQTNWHIRQKAKDMQTMYIHDPENNADFERISKPDQDIDTTYVFTNNGSLDSLFSFIQSNVPGAVKQIDTKTATDGTEVHVRHLDYTDTHNTHIHLEFGPIITNTSLMHMTMGFYKNNARVFHIDIAKFPSDGMEALNQKRIGGDTLEAQDIYLPITCGEEHKTMYTVNSSTAYGVLHKERIFIKDKDMKPVDVAELANRALRIHLIHSEQLFTSPSLKTLTHLFYTKGDGGLFDIRKSIQTIIRSGEHMPKEKFDLLRTELLICMANDPYETAKFLQDTGIYLLVPGLKNFTQADWKSLFTSTAFTFLREGEPIVHKSARSIESVTYSHKKFKAVRWNEGVNGIQRFIRAFGEVMKEKMPNLDLNNYDEMYTTLFKIETVRANTPEKRQANTLKTALLSLFKTYPSGMTEREIQTHLEATWNKKVSLEMFQEALFDIKSQGLINRQTRQTADRENVVFYSPRLTTKGVYDVRTTPITHKEIHEAIMRAPIVGMSTQTKEMLEQHLLLLPCKSIEAFRVLRSYDRERLTTMLAEFMQQEGIVSVSQEAVMQFITEVQQATRTYSKKRSL